MTVAGDLLANGLTIVTAVGEETGGKTFKAVGAMLRSLLGTAVASITPHSSGGAYTVKLTRLLPSEKG